MEINFNGKKAIVTGAGRGIGRAIAQRLSELGATVYAISKNPANLEELKAKNPNIKTVAIDLGNWKAAREALEQIEVVDCLVNNAAIYIPGYFMGMTEEDIDTTCNVNLKSVVNVSQVVAKKMIEAGKGGSIVNISSSAGIKPMPAGSVYSTFKGALDHLTKNMAIELASKKIRVNSVNPGMTMTDMLQTALDAEKAANPDNDSFAQFGTLIPTEQKIVEIYELVNAVIYLLSDLSPMVVGTILAVDGGFCST